MLQSLLNLALRILPGVQVTSSVDWHKTLTKELLCCDSKDAAASSTQERQQVALDHSLAPDSATVSYARRLLYALRILRLVLLLGVILPSYRCSTFHLGGGEEVKPGVAPASAPAIHTNLRNPQSTGDALHSALDPRAGYVVLLLAALQPPVKQAWVKRTFGNKTSTTSGEPTRSKAAYPAHKAKVSTQVSEAESKSLTPTFSVERVLKFITAAVHHVNLALFLVLTFADTREVVRASFSSEVLPLGPEFYDSTSHAQVLSVVHREVSQATTGGLEASKIAQEEGVVEGVANGDGTSTEYGERSEPRFSQNHSIFELSYVHALSRWAKVPLLHLCVAPSAIPLLVALAHIWDDDEASIAMRSEVWDQEYPIGANGPTLKGRNGDASLLFGTKEHATFSVYAQHPDLLSDMIFDSGRLSLANRAQLCNHLVFDFLSRVSRQQLPLQSDVPIPGAHPTTAAHTLRYLLEPHILHPTSDLSFISQEATFHLSPRKRPLQLLTDFAEQTMTLLRLGTGVGTAGLRDGIKPLERKTSRAEHTTSGRQTHRSDQLLNLSTAVLATLLLDACGVGVPIRFEEQDIVNACAVLTHILSLESNTGSLALVELENHSKIAIHSLVQRFSFALVHLLNLLSLLAIPVTTPAGPAGAASQGLSLTWFDNLAKFAVHLLKTRPVTSMYPTLALALELVLKLLASHGLLMCHDAQKEHQRQALLRAGDLMELLTDLVASPVSTGTREHVSESMSEIGQTCASFLATYVQDEGIPLTLKIACLAALDAFARLWTASHLDQSMQLGSHGHLSEERFDTRSFFLLDHRFLHALLREITPASATRAPPELGLRSTSTDQRIKPECIIVPSACILTTLDIFARLDGTDNESYELSPQTRISRTALLKISRDYYVWNLLTISISVLGILVIKTKLPGLDSSLRTNQVLRCSSMALAERFPLLRRSEHSQTLHLFALLSVLPSPLSWVAGLCVPATGPGNSFSSKRARALTAAILASRSILTTCQVLHDLMKAQLAFRCLEADGQSDVLDFAPGDEDMAQAALSKAEASIRAAREDQALCGILSQLTRMKNGPVERLWALLAMEAEESLTWNARVHSGNQDSRPYESQDEHDVEVDEGLLPLIETDPYEATFRGSFVIQRLCRRINSVNQQAELCTSMGPMAASERRGISCAPPPQMSSIDVFSRSAPVVGRINNELGGQQFADSSVTFNNHPNNRPPDLQLDDLNDSIVRDPEVIAAKDEQSASDGKGVTERTLRKSGVKALFFPAESRNIILANVSLLQSALQRNLRLNLNGLQRILRPVSSWRHKIELNPSSPPATALVSLECDRSFVTIPLYANAWRLYERLIKSRVQQEETRLALAKAVQRATQAEEKWSQVNVVLSTLEAEIQSLAQRYQTAQEEFAKVVQQRDQELENAANRLEDTKLEAAARIQELISTHEKRVNVLQTQIDDLVRAGVEVSETLRQSQEDYAQLMTEKELVESQVTAKAHEVQQQLSRIQDLEAEITHLNTRISEWEAKCNDAHDQIGKLSDELVDERRRRESTTLELAKQKEICDALTVQIAENEGLSRELVLAKAQTADREYDLKEAQAKYEAARKEVQDLQLQLKESQRRMEEMELQFQNERKAWDVERNKMAQRGQQHMAEVIATKFKIKTLKDRMAQRDDLHEAEKKFFQSNLKSRDDNIAALTQRVHDLEDRYKRETANLQAQQVRLEEQLTATRTERDQWKQRAKLSESDAVARQEQLEQERKSATARHQEQEQVIARLQQDYQRLEKTVSEMVNELTAVSKERNTANATIEQLTEALQNSQTQYLETYQALGQLRTQHDWLLKKYQKQKQELLEKKRTLLNAMNVITSQANGESDDESDAESDASIAAFSVHSQSAATREFSQPTLLPAHPPSRTSMDGKSHETKSVAHSHISNGARQATARLSSSTSARATSQTIAQSADRQSAATQSVNRPTLATRVTKPFR